MGFMVNVLLHIKSKEKSNFVFFIHLHGHTRAVNNVSNLSIREFSSSRRQEHISLMLYLDSLRFSNMTQKKKISILLTNLDPGSCRCVSGGWGFRTSEKGISALKRICISRKTILEVFRKEGFLAFIILVLPMQMPEVYKDKGIFC